MGGRACEVLPPQKGGAGKVSAMLKGGGGGRTTSFGVVFTWLLEVLAILKGWCKRFLCLKGGV